VDGELSSIRFWGQKTGPNPTDRAKLGSKRHLISAGQGSRHSGGSTHRSEPQRLTASSCTRRCYPAIARRAWAASLLSRLRARRRGYDAHAIRQGLRARGIVPWLAKRNTAHGSGLGRWRWVVERTFAWLNQFRRLRVRYEKRADIHEAFLALGCILIRWRFLDG